MSDLQDVIHINAKLAYEQGVKNERERIIKMLSEATTGEIKLLNFNSNRSDFKQRQNKISIANQFIDLIKGEQK